MTIKEAYKLSNMWQRAWLSGYIDASVYVEVKCQFKKYGFSNAWLASWKAIKMQVEEVY